MYLSEVFVATLLRNGPRELPVRVIGVSHQARYLRRSRKTTDSVYWYRT